MRKGEREEGERKGKREEKGESTMGDVCPGAYLLFFSCSSSSFLACIRVAFLCLSFAIRWDLIFAQSSTVAILSTLTIFQTLLKSSSCFASVMRVAICWSDCCWNCSISVMRVAICWLDCCWSSLYNFRKINSEGQQGSGGNRGEWRRMEESGGEEE